MIKNILAAIVYSMSLYGCMKDDRAISLDSPNEAYAIDMVPIEGHMYRVLRPKNPAEPISIEHDFKCGNRVHRANTFYLLSDSIIVNGNRDTMVPPAVEHGTLNDEGDDTADEG